MRRSSPTTSNRTRLNLTALEDRTTPTVTVSVITAGAEPNANGTFRFTRDGNTSSALTADITVTGTATSGTDYTSIGTTVTFPANVDTVDVSIVPIDDTIYDPNETIIVGTDGGNATMTLADNEMSDAAPQILDYRAENLGNGLYRFTGRVVDEVPGGRTITFDGGVTMSGKTTTTNSDGTFSYTVQLLTNGSDDGLVSASTRDPLNQASNVPEAYVNPSL